MLANLNSEALKISEFCNSSFKKYEPWPHYFRQRKHELNTLLKFCDIDRSNTILEVGCGCGFLSALLSQCVKRIISIDLPFADPATHSLGLKRAQDLFSALNLKNVDLIGGSIEEIPLKSASVDMVFSHCVLEHVAIEQRKKSLNEIRRVLTPNGTVISVLPNFLFSIYNFPYHYLNLFFRLTRFCIQTMLSKKNASLKNSYSQKANKLKTIVSGKDFHRLLLPPIHGKYRSRLQEISKSFPLAWQKLFRQNGFKIIKVFTIRFIPYSNRLSVSLMEKTEQLTSYLGEKIPFKYLGIHNCLICKKI